MAHHEFETSAEWTRGREVKVEAPGLPSIDVASPPEFSGPGGRWSPEHFFVASAAACTLLTFVAMAEYSKLAVRGLRSAAKGTVEKVEGEGYRFTGIEMTIEVEVEKAGDADRAERLIHKAEAACLVSKSMKTPVRVTARVRS